MPAAGPVQPCPGNQVGLERLKRTFRKAHYRLAITFADNHRLALEPIHVSAMQPAGFVNAQPGIRQGDQEGGVA